MSDQVSMVEKFANGTSLTSDERAEIVQFIEHTQAGIRRAWDMLEVLGVPRDRAKTVANGIDVLATRFRKQAEVASAALADQTSRLKEYALIIKSMQDNLDTVFKQREALQAKLDAVMLEHCPSEMTPEQIVRWEKSQRIAPCGLPYSSGPKGE